MDWKTSVEAGKEKLGKVGMVGVGTVRMSKKIPEGFIYPGQKLGFSLLCSDPLTLG